MRYTIVSDESSHKYLIPADRRDQWYSFLDSEEAELGRTPDWARQIEGALLTFESPEYGGKTVEYNQTVGWVKAE